MGALQVTPAHCPNCHTESVVHAHDARITDEAGTRIGTAMWCRNCEWVAEVPDDLIDDVCENSPCYEPEDEPTRAFYPSC